MMPNKRIHFNGWANKRNLGDKLFKLYLEQKLITKYQLSFSEKFDMAADLNVLGPGDVVKEYYMREVPKRWVAFGVGLGYESEIDILTRHNCQMAWFRHEKPDFMVPEQYRFGYADLIWSHNFTIAPPRSKSLLVILSDAMNIRTSIRQKPELIGLIEHWKWELAAALDEASKYYKIEFFPMSDESGDRDLRTIYDIEARMQERSKTLIHDYTENLDHINRIFSGVSAVVSAKYHGLLLGMAHNKPTLSIGWAQKNKYMLREVEHPFSNPDVNYKKDTLMSFLKYAESGQLPNTEKMKERSNTMWSEFHSYIASVL